MYITKRNKAQKKKKKTHWFMQRKEEKNLKHKVS